MSKIVPTQPFDIQSFKCLFPDANDGVLLRREDPPIE